MPDKPFVFVDVETTGCSYAHDRIIEIGIVRVESNQPTTIYHSLINPGMHLPPEITTLTGILPQELDTAPTFNQLKQDIFTVLDGAIFVAHNSSFDYGFVKAELKRHGIPYTNRHLCTVKLSRRLYPHERHHNLDAVIDRCGLTCSARHRALGDAEVLWQFLQFAQNQFGSSQIEAHIKDLLKIPSLPATIPHSVIDNLPEAPGVYLFYGEGGAPLYVGKSINLQDRVLGHFAASGTSTSERRLAETIRSLEVIPTAGDLHAQLLESHLIKQIQPIFNRQLRHARNLLTLTQSTNPQGFYSVTFQPINRLSDYPINCIGIFRSQNQAKQKLRELVDLYHLCPKLLGLESGKGACFNSHLNLCHGACTGKENPLKYNLRFLEAFTPLKLKRWPFSGPITIHEQFDDLEALHTVNDWQVIDSSYSGFPLHTAYCIRHTHFDLDMYKILSRYILNPRHQSSIHLS